jgi:DNA-binding beta-propeller fold protein YncE
MSGRNAHITRLVVILTAAGTAASPPRGSEAPPRLEYPVAVAAAPDGTMYIADAKLHAIVKRDPQGKLEVVARSGDKDRSPLRALRAIACEPDGGVLAADTATSDVYRIQRGQPPQALTGGTIDMPNGIVIDRDGSIVVTDLRLNNLVRVPKLGGVPTEIASLPAPRGVALGPDGGFVVLSSGPNQLLYVSAKGEVKPFVKGKPFRFPIALASGPADGTFVVADVYAKTVWLVGAKGEVRPLSQGTPLERPEGLTRDASGTVLLADPSARQIFRIGADGTPEPVVK